MADDVEKVVMVEPAVQEGKMHASEVIEILERALALAKAGKLAGLYLSLAKEREDENIEVTAEIRCDMDAGMLIYTTILETMPEIFLPLAMEYVKDVDCPHCVAQLNEVIKDLRKGQRGKTPSGATH